MLETSLVQRLVRLSLTNLFYLAEVRQGIEMRSTMKVWVHVLTTYVLKMTEIDKTKFGKKFSDAEVKFLLLLDDAYVEKPSSVYNISCTVLILKYD